SFSVPQRICRHASKVIGRKKGFINKSMGITELICSADMATGVKMGVVCGLYGGAVINLGSPEQVERLYVPVTVSSKHFTSFCMTCFPLCKGPMSWKPEFLYNPSSKLGRCEFIIHTPCEDAQKMYIGNAMKGNYAAVFAQLIINGESQGPHCFVVPVRDQYGVMWPGVTATDMKHKEGLHGVDNGILIFDNVRIPRENLLDKFGSVSADGRYSSPIRRKGDRFNAMLAALTPTRLALTVQAMAAMKVIVSTSTPTSFGPKDQDEVKIIEHQTQYLRLMPHLAATLALTFTTRYTAGLMDDALCQGEDLQSNRPLQALVAGLKAYSTWANVACLQECRECTGGMGFMMENRIPSLKCDSDVFVTFEGDNMVMLQVVVRELMMQYTRQFEDSMVAGLIRNWTSSVSDSLRTSFLGFSVDKIGDLNFLLKALSYRERVLQRSLAARLHAKINKSKEEFFSAWNSCLHHVTSLALAHIHKVTLKLFALAVQECQVNDDRDLLTKFCLLHGTSLVYQERAWYLEHNYFSPGASRQIRSQLLELCKSVKDDALKVVADFNIPPCCIQAPIAGVAKPGAEWAFYPQPQSPTTQPHTQQRATSKL
uniref:Acyl-coenzyme A oxidase n=1 Tax=Pygocentrus nattereri TaxID=42514 RepID=A0AAR2IPZ4_PYGNA